MGVLVRALNVRPQLLQRKRKSPCEQPQPMIAWPAQCGQPWVSTRSWLVVPSASSRRPRFAPCSGEASARSLDAQLASTPFALVSACKASPRCSALKPAIADSQAEKSPALIESPLDPTQD